METMTFFTRRDYEALPEGFPAQLVDGFLVREPSPSYGHQLVQTARAIDVVRVDAHERALGADAVTSRAVPGFRLVPDELFVPPA